MPNPNQPNANDAAKMKRDVLRGMRNGIELLPCKTEMHFEEEDCLGVEQAVHLGSLTFEELVATATPTLSLQPQDWPSPEVTYLLHDQDKTHLVWLHLGANKVHVTCFSKRLGRTVMLPPLVLTAGGHIMPFITVIGISPHIMQMAMNASRCALDGGAIMLARHGARPAAA